MSVDPREPHDPAKTAAPPPAKPAERDLPGSESQPQRQITPEEQMALFEQELKETDWGHQPC
jgi:hypothetical protein